MTASAWSSAHDDTPESARQRRWTITLLTFATFCSMFAQRVCDAMLPELARVFEVGLAQAAQVVSVFAVAYGLAQLVYGPMGDRLGKFPLVIFGVATCAVGCVLSAMAPTLIALIAARVVTALGVAAIVPLALAWIGDNVAFDRLQEMLARVGLGTTLGLTAGQFLGGLLTEFAGWRVAFAFLAALCAIAAGLLLFDHRRQQRRAAAVTPAPGPMPANPHRGALFVGQAKAIAIAPWSRLVLLIAFGEGAAGYGLLAMWPVHLHRSLDLTLASAGGIVSLFGIGGMAYMALARGLIARLGQQGLCVVGGCLLALSAVVTAFAPVWQVVVPACLGAGFGFNMFHNTMQTNAAQMAPASRGTGVSLFAGSMFLGQSAGALIAAYSFERIGSTAVVALGGVAMLGMSLGFSWALKRRAGQLSRA